MFSDTDVINVVILESSVLSPLQRSTSSMYFSCTDVIKVVILERSHQWRSFELTSSFCCTDVISIAIL